MKNEELSRRGFLEKSVLALGAFWIVPRHVLGGKSAFGTQYLSPSDKINLGFIGTGKQGRGLVNSFLQTKQVNLVAAAEVYAAKADLFKSRVKEIFEKNEDLGVFQDFPNFVDYREVLSRKDIDAVVIATPDHWHGAMAVKAAEAGKDIYCEKPLALTIKEGRAMVNAARKHKRVFQTGSMQRSWPEFRQAAELIRNGYIGDIKQIVVNVGPPPKKYDLQEETVPEGLDWMKWLGPNEFSVFNAELAPPISKDVFPNWRNYKEFGGGMVTDWGAHMFDIVQWALDMDASGPTQILPPDGKEIKHLTYIYANGIKMTHEKWDWNNAIKFVGAEGEIRVQRRKLESNPESLKDRVIKDTEIKVYKSENHYVDFLDAMRSRKNPICDVEIGHRTASVCTLGNIAYELGVPLSWNPKKESFNNNKAANQLLGRKLNKEWGIKI